VFSVVPPDVPRPGGGEKAGHRDQDGQHDDQNGGANQGGGDPAGHARTAPLQEPVPARRMLGEVEFGPDRAHLVIELG
jgi:hypothetical protein